MGSNPTIPISALLEFHQKEVYDLSKLKMKALRVNAGLSQGDAAKALNVSPKTLQNWENYITFPSALQLVEMCRLYGCNLNDIFLPSTLAKSETEGEESEENLAVSE